MGKAKAKMELIKDDKKRMITFKTRKHGLIKKFQELTTLCDVNGCLIIYAPNEGTPEIWPQNSDHVNRVIHAYKAKNESGECSKTTSGLADFFQEKKKQVEEEIRNRRKKKMEAKYPIPTAFLDGLTETQLRELATALADKFNSLRLKSRIQFLHRSNNAAALRLESYKCNSISNVPNQTVVADQGICNPGFQVTHENPNFCLNSDFNSIPNVSDEAAVADQGFLNPGFQVTHENLNFCLNPPTGIVNPHPHPHRPVIETPNLWNLHHPQQHEWNPYSAYQLNNSMVQLPNLVMTGGNNFRCMENNQLFWRYPTAGPDMISHVWEPTSEYYYQHHALQPPTMAPPLPAGPLDCCTPTMAPALPVDDLSEFDGHPF